MKTIIILITATLSILAGAGCRTPEPAPKTIPTRSSPRTDATNDTDPSTKSRRTRPERTADVSLEIPTNEPKKAKLVIRFSSDF